MAVVLATAVVIVDTVPRAGGAQPIAVHNEVARDLVHAGVDGNVARVGRVVHDRLPVPRIKHAMVATLAHAVGEQVVLDHVRAAKALPDGAGKE